MEKTSRRRWSRRTLDRGGASDQQATPTAFAPDTGSDERRVIHALRAAGWYVADDVAFEDVEADHIAIGPAGVLAVQVMWTDRPDGRGKASIRARVAAERLHRLLASRECPVEVVPAVLAFGPGLTVEPGGVKVVDSVAVLFGDQSPQWVDELSRRSLLPEATVEAVRAIVGELREVSLYETEVAQPLVAVSA